MNANASRTLCLAVAALALGLCGSVQAQAQAKTLRLLTWADNVPADVKAEFEKETGYKVEITLANNDEMISKLRATGKDTGFDLAQPSLDRILAAQQELKLYRPLDLGKIRTELFIPAILAATKKNSTLQGTVYAVPHVWGTEGLAVNTKIAKIANYPDLCKPEYKGKTAVRLRRATLLGFAFGAGKDPFALYNNPKAYAALMDDVGKALVACKAKLRFWDGRDQLQSELRSEQLVGAMMWDAGALKLNRESADIQYVAPKSGALGWIDTFALPARGRNDDAAYAWINFNLRPQVAAKVAASAGYFTASSGAEQFMDAKLKAQFAASFTPAVLSNIKWYPAAPANLDEIENRVLERVRTANDKSG